MCILTRTLTCSFSYRAGTCFLRTAAKTFNWSLLLLNQASCCHHQLSSLQKNYWESVTEISLASLFFTARRHHCSLCYREWRTALRTAKQLNGLHNEQHRLYYNS